MTAEETQQDPARTGTAAIDEAWARRLADDLAAIGRDVFAAGDAADPDVLAMLTKVTLERVAAAEWVTVTTLRAGEFTTAAATHEMAAGADRLQYVLGSGPCVEAVVGEPLYHAPDVAADPRWPEYGRRVAAEYGVRAMLAFRLALEADDVIGALNLYATRAEAFDARDRATGLLIAVHGALVVSAAAVRQRVGHLQRALESNREIGVAIGVIMSTYKVPRDQAFALLRIASQHTNRKLRDIALDVTETGLLPLPEHEAALADEPPPGPGTVA